MPPYAGHNHLALAAQFAEPPAITDAERWAYVRDHLAWQSGMKWWGLNYPRGSFNTFTEAIDNAIRSSAEEIGSRDA